MAVRVRADGRVLCAAMHAAAPGDAYLDDHVHYVLSCGGVLVTEAMTQKSGRGGHETHGEWWWRGGVPGDVVLEDR